MTAYNYQGAMPHRQRPPKAPVAKCGTLSGYNRHNRLGEAQCDDCRAVNIAECGRWRTVGRFAEEALTRARFEYFRNAEAGIDAGPEVIAA